MLESRNDDHLVTIHDETENKAAYYYTNVMVLKNADQGILEANVFKKINCKEHTYLRVRLDGSLDIEYPLGAWYA